MDVDQAGNSAPALINNADQRDKGLYVHSHF